MKIYDIYTNLLNAFGASGREDEISSVITEMISPYCDETYRDNIGNLIAVKKGTANDAKKIMFAAHMDSIGMVATFVDDKGFIRFSSVGGLSKYDMINIPVRFSNGTMGVISHDEKVTPRDLMLSDMYIDIGAKSKEDALSQISIGDFAVFVSTPFIQGDIMCGAYMDNRIGCAVLIDALSQIENQKDDLYFVFTAQEEVGLRGATVATYSIAPDMCIAVDVTDTGDTPERKHYNSVFLGKGIAIKVMDRSVISNAEVRELLTDTAVNQGIDHQFEIMEFGGTDAGAAQKSRGGVLTGGIAIPTRYIHSPCEMVSISDVQNAVSLIVNVVK